MQIFILVWGCSDILMAMASLGGLEAEPVPRPAKRSHSSLEADDDQPFNPSLGSSFCGNGNTFVAEGGNRVDVNKDGINLGATAQAIDSEQQSREIPGVDTSFELPFYSDELSRPFMMEGNPSLDIPPEKHLDELEAMWDQIQAMNSNTASATDDLKRSTPNASNLFHANPSPTHTSPEADTEFGDLQSNALGLSPTMGSLGNQPYFEHLQGAELWTAVPLGYEYVSPAVLYHRLADTNLMTV
ncbi:hypothetical protein EST38_g166 [Candolleomyces aberdarensis]|uniref:Uncharacterized protein n=1 Tax=Candolleomyces aberdarensis TaxID=2316362 RepID=A0A4Q2DZ70_9AGAR|nr:hypothetical protein EST38_g166 [Candolleomyces aberdarensis]